MDMRLTAIGVPSYLERSRSLPSVASLLQPLLPVELHSSAPVESFQFQSFSPSPPPESHTQALPEPVATSIQRTSVVSPLAQTLDFSQGFGCQLLGQEVSAASDDPTTKHEPLMMNFSALMQSQSRVDLPSTPPAAPPGVAQNAPEMKSVFEWMGDTSEPDPARPLPKKVDKATFDAYMAQETANDTRTFQGFQKSMLGHPQL